MKTEHHTFWLRPDFKVHFTLPSDFTQQEAERLSAAIQTFVIPQESAPKAKRCRMAHVHGLLCRDPRTRDRCVLEDGHEGDHEIEGGPCNSRGLAISAEPLESESDEL